MPTRVVGIAGSPRRRGNSTAMLEAALDGAARAGAQVELVYLDSISFRGCRGCPACAPQERCVIDDALTPVMHILCAAPIWLLASPVYYDMVSGQFKTFFDRLRWLSYTDSERRPRLQGARRAGIILTYADHHREDYQRLGQVLAGYLQWFGEFEEVSIMAQGGLGPVGAAAADPALLARSRAMGEGLVRALPPSTPAGEHHEDGDRE